MAVTAAVLRELHRIHIQLTDLRERLARGPRQVQARETNVKRQEEAFAKAQAEVKAARIVADQKQLLLKTSEGKIAELKIKLNQAKNNREFQALKDQIAADQMAGSVLADEILETLEKIDELQLKVAEAQKTLAAAKDELGKSQQTVRDHEGLIRGDIARLEAELSQSERHLPEDFRESYQRIVQARGSDAMAAIEGESCGGCHHQITPNMMNELALSRLVLCRSCGRLLYLAEDRVAIRRPPESGE